MNILERISLLSETKRWWLSIASTLLVNCGLYVLLIYFGHLFGIAVFGLVPLTTGLMATWLYGFSRDISRLSSIGISFTTLIFLICLLVFAGALTTQYLLFMVLVSFNLCWIGSTIGRMMIKKI
ncbi:MAG: hypothetical protein J7604_01595 [Sporocytophaga sp.]|uniref:hypothetical protein n=1 Tax=Sporocytophaga sp. TaxID=2231183 RepID=UPI001B268DD3|nr:hypothetical protein [Sporocytophaga sp.]MBO9698867.1 hypothetical protein [Sporocytophaga sp.]